jgi:hypothetical protein
MQKEQPQGRVMPERYVCTQRYALQQSSVSNRNDLDYSAPELSRFYSILYYSQWYMDGHFSFFIL